MDEQFQIRYLSSHNSDGACEKTVMYVLVAVTQ